MKFTIDHAITAEAEALADALGGRCLELNNEFLERYCSEDLAKLLKVITCEKERALILDSHLTDDNWRVMSGLDEGSDINLLVGELEIQFDGEAEDFFEDPSDWYIKGDLAYMGLDGICWTVDLDSLQQDVNDWTENQQAEVVSGVTC
tara:strand:+ start:1283 stop:1726 length:444 start_codon:yes stop_codon:yes gene_type:complete